MKKKNGSKSLSLTIGWLYPDLMSTYGDRGNVIVLQKRCELRGIKTEVKKIFVASGPNEVSSCDILFMGGAQDTQQEIVNKDLFEKKGKTIAELINSGTPGLFICGAYQFLGKYYKTAEGIILPGLSLFPVYTENPGEHTERLIGNIIIKPTPESGITQELIVGFENHGGRTYLENETKPFATVIHGYGNNGKDQKEGLLYKNAIGTYLHGPLLPKNPQLADWLIERALLKRYKANVHLKNLDDSFAVKAKETIFGRYKTT